MKCPVIVVGVPRSGTTFVAECLRDEFGITMYLEDLAYCEDKTVVNLNRKLSWKMCTFDEYKEGMTKHFSKMSKFERWGFKDPRTILGLLWIIDYLKPTIIRTYRDKELVVKSLIKNLNWDRDLAELTYDGQMKLLDAALKDTKTINVRYDGTNRMSKTDLIKSLTEGNLNECFNDVRQIVAVGGY